MELLISKSDVEKQFEIATGRKEKEFNTFIREAQQFMLKKIMPEQLYYKVTATPENYTELLDENAYECGGNTYHHSGLKSVLVQFTYGLYLLKSNMKDTSYGVVVKQSGESEPANYKERMDWYVRHEQQGNELYKEIQHYIQCKGLDKEAKCNSNSTNKKFKTSVIK